MSVYIPPSAPLALPHTIKTYEISRDKCIQLLVKITLLVAEGYGMK